MVVWVGNAGSVLADGSGSRCIASGGGGIGEVGGWWVWVGVARTVTVVVHGVGEVGAWCQWVWVGDAGSVLAGGSGIESVRCRQW